MVRFLMSFLILSISANAQVNETFDDGNFTTNPEWIGSTSKFRVNAELKLQLDAPAEASLAWLFTPSISIENASWQIDFGMDFNPSSSNNAKIWITADNHDPLAIKNGVFISIGVSDDAVSLQSLSNGKTTTLIKGLAGRLNTDKISASLRVIREGDTWTLDVKTTDEWLSEGSATYRPTAGSQWFGLFCTYTQTRSNKFWFDNIIVTGEPLSDREKPFVTTHKMTTPSRIMLEFNEPITITGASALFSVPTDHQATLSQENQQSVSATITPTTIDLSNEKLYLKGFSDLAGNIINDTTLNITYTLFKVISAHVKPPSTLIFVFNQNLAAVGNQQQPNITVNQSITPTTLTINESTLEVLFPMTFNEGENHSINLSGITDLYGNMCLPFSSTVGYNNQIRHAILISEFMADPEPTMGLPESEYIELYNNTLFSIDLKEWQLKVNQTTATLPAYTLLPDDYVILTSSSSLSQFGTTKKIAPSRWPAITNSEASIIISSPQGVTSDAIRFNLTEWGDRTFKDNGGWAFEIIDTKNRCAQAKNWNYSTNLMGGTPGESNSIKASNPDEEPPRIVHTKVNDDMSLTLFFNEPVETGMPQHIETTINNTKEIGEVLVKDTVFYQSVTLASSDPPSRGMTYTISEIAITDIAGNKPYLNKMARFGMTETAESQDAVINEIMFNTTGGAPDFLEIYNNSDKILNLKQMSIGKLSNGIIKSLTPISAAERLFFPGDYIVSAPDSLLMLSSYNVAVAEWVVKTQAFPSLSDDGECIMLAHSNGESIESFCFDKKMHHPLLKIQDGVSLERVSPNASATMADNWQTASSTAGYSTPTAQNSQYRNIENEQNGTITIQPSYFTPDGDGYDDQLSIIYQTDEPKWTATVKIFDARGREVRIIANNQLIGTEGFWMWNGLDDNSSLLPLGNYIILIKMFHPNGRVKELRKSCTMGVPFKK